MGGIPFAFCTLLGCFFLLLGIFVHKIGAVGNSIALIVLLQLLKLAAELGFEPRQTESESVVLPLHNRAMNINDYTIFSLFVKRFVLGKKNFY